MRVLTARRTATTLLSLVLVAGWVAAAILLWQSSVVPAGIKLGGLDEHRYFSQHVLAETASFTRIATLISVLALLATLAAAAAYARWGELWAGASLAGPVGTGTLLGMAGLAVVWLAQLPFAFLGVWWERRHGLVHTGYVSAVFQDWGTLAGEFVFASAALLVVMTLARRLGERWWLVGAPLFTAVTLLFVWVQPWLTPTHALHDRRIAAAAAQLERREGTGHVKIVVEDVSAETSAPNAEAVGLGSSRRVILWSTLLDGRFTQREIRVVLAHELGHQKRNHLWKGVAWSGLLWLPLAFLLARGTRRRGGMGNPEAVPLALAIVVAVQVAVTPLQTLVTRHIEEEADWMALQYARDPSAQVSLFRRFAPTTLEPPDPPLLRYVLFEDHPTLMQRIALAEAWRARGRR
jgi:STE24 endopeptidase